jgi:hypothetical protein
MPRRRVNPQLYEVDVFVNSGSDFHLGDCFVAPLLAMTCAGPVIASEAKQSLNGNVLPYLWKAPLSDCQGTGTGSPNGPGNGARNGGLSGNLAAAGIGEGQGGYRVRESLGISHKLYGSIGSAAIALCGK